MFLFLAPCGNNEDARFSFLGLKCRKAKSESLSKTVAVPIEDTRGNPPHSNNSATSFQDECCCSLMSAAPAHFNLVQKAAFRLVRYTPGAHPCLSLNWVLLPMPCRPAGPASCDGQFLGACMF